MKEAIKVTLVQMAKIINGQECLFKFYEDNALKYASCFVDTGCLHLSSLQTFREAEGGDRDEMDGLVLSDLKIGDWKIFDNDYMYNPHHTLVINENDSDITYNTKLLNNYVLCMSCCFPNPEIDTNERIPIEDIKTCIENHGKYIVVISDWIKFIKQLIGTRNKPCRLIASKVVNYVDTYQLDIFSKRSKFAHEHEYRFAFDLINEKAASLNMSIGSIANFAEIYEVVDIV